MHGEIELPPALRSGSHCQGACPRRSPTRSAMSGSASSQAQRTWWPAPKERYRVALSRDRRASRLFTKARGSHDRALTRTGQHAHRRSEGRLTGESGGADLRRRGKLATPLIRADRRLGILAEATSLRRRWRQRLASDRSGGARVRYRARPRWRKPRPRASISDLTALLNAQANRREEFVLRATMIADQAPAPTVTTAECAITVRSGRMSATKRKSPRRGDHRSTPIAAIPLSLYDWPADRRVATASCAISNDDVAGVKPLFVCAEFATTPV